MPPNYLCWGLPKKLHLTLEVPSDPVIAQVLGDTLDWQLAASGSKHALATANILSSFGYWIKKIYTIFLLLLLLRTVAVIKIRLALQRMLIYA